MKKFIIIPVLALLIIAPGCSSLKKLGIAPSELEMALALKEALSQGLFRAFDAFNDPNGNPLVRFAFPGEAEKIERTLRDLGFDKAINQLTGKFTKVMSTAVSVARPLFFDALKSMSFKDAVKILVTDNSHAATDYFKGSMKPGLMIAFRPIVDSSIRIEGADKEWMGIMKVYNAIPFINKPIETNLTDFISARAVDLMFVFVAAEEEQIRNKYEFRKTDLMKKAFGYAEQQLKRRMEKR